MGPDVHDVCVNAGGDVIAWTVSDGSAAWRVGIENPADTSEVVAVVEVRRADVYATAAVVKGADALDWIESLDGYEGLVVDRDGRVGTTSGFDVRTEPADVSGPAT